MRKIIHIDMDCFYAAIEMREDPSLVGKPVGVGGESTQRGVLCTANYEARQFGVHSAMPTAQAFKQCPDLILKPVQFPLYRAVSKSIQDIFKQYTDLVEPLSLDEAYLDVTDYPEQATLIAQEIRQKIYDKEQLTASAGISVNKFLAKVASDWRKPNGQFAVKPHQVAEFVVQLPVKKIFGVGKVTQKKMLDLGVVTCADLQTWSQAKLVEHFGKFGLQLYNLCRGVDHRPVNPERVRKSLSVEETFAKNLNTVGACLAHLPALFENLTKRLEKLDQATIAKQFVKVKFHDFQQTTVESTSQSLSLELFQTLLSEGFARGDRPVRLLGIGVGFKQSAEVEQQELLL